MIFGNNFSSSLPVPLILRCPREARASKDGPAERFRWHPSRLADDIGSHLRVRKRERNSKRRVRQGAERAAPTHSIPSLRAIAKQSSRYTPNWIASSLSLLAMTRNMRSPVEWVEPLRNPSCSLAIERWVSRSRTAHAPSRSRFGRRSNVGGQVAQPILHELLTWGRIATPVRTLTARKTGSAVANSISRRAPKRRLSLRST